MILVSIIAGLGIGLFFLPYGFQRVPTSSKDLFGRIQVEQQARYESSFQHSRRLLPVLQRLRRDHLLAQRLSRYVGIDQNMVKAQLERLRWQVGVEEILLAKLLGAALIIAMMVYLYRLLQAGGSLSYAQIPVITGAVAAFLLPTQILEWADKRAKEEIRLQIPAFFSIVQSLVEAGMPVHSAVKATARRDSSRLGRELAYLEIEGKRYGNWRRALEVMAHRWEVDALAAIALEINEALTKGVSISQMLAAQVEEQLRQQEAEAEATTNRLQVRLLPLLIIFMGLPLMFLVMGPAFMGIKSTL